MRQVAPGQETARHDPGEYHGPEGHVQGLRRGGTFSAGTDYTFLSDYSLCRRHHTNDYKDMILEVVHTARVVSKSGSMVSSFICITKPLLLPWMVLAVHVPDAVPRRRREPLHDPAGEGPARGCRGQPAEEVRRVVPPKKRGVPDAQFQGVPRGVSSCCWFF